MRRSYLSFQLRGGIWHTCWIGAHHPTIYKETNISTRAQPLSGFTSNLALSSTGLRQQAAPDQDSPNSIHTDLTVASNPNSPQTPRTPIWTSKPSPQQSLYKDLNLAHINGERGSQCDGPQNFARASDQFSMSQRRPVAPSASSHTTSRPPTREGYFPPQDAQAPIHRSIGGSPQLGHGAATTSSQVPPRLLGVQNILNPSDQRLPALDSDEPYPPSRDYGHGPAQPSTSRNNTPRPYYAGHASNSYTGQNPLPSPTAHMTGSSYERLSPPLQYPPPAIQHSGRVLSPTGSRTAGSSQRSPRDSGSHQPSRMPNISLKRPSEDDHSEGHRRRAFGGDRPPSLPQTPTSSAAPIARSFSQPVSQGPNGPHAPPSQPQNAQGAYNLPPSSSAQTHRASGLPPGRSLSASSTSGPSGSSMSAFTDAAHRSGFQEGHQAFMNVGGSVIPVAFDMVQASKKADEKRSRNAKASTRHRQKRKAQQEENVKQLQSLRDERDEMFREIEELIVQRDFYRNDRNRLRDLVHCTPAIADKAESQPSPPASHRTFARLSPLSHSNQPPTPTGGYTSEGSSSERPSQRQRYDDRGEGSMSAYGTPTIGTPTGHSVMHAPFYGAPQLPPSASSSTAGDRLPPLRSLEGSPPTHGQHEQDLRTGHWVPIQPTQYETGWATDPRRANEGQPRYETSRQ